MAGTKVDFRRELRELYTATARPAWVDVPELDYLMVDGHGDPNTSPEYVEAVSTLYTVAYATKFAVRQAGGIDYTVMPLEGLWWVPDMSRFTMKDKAAWDWTMMIVQPVEVTDELLDLAKAKAAAKGLPGERVRRQRWAEGRAAQVLHLGPYGAEGPTIAALHAFIADQGLRRTGKHHEVYLGDPRRAAPEKLRTILRQPAG